MSQLRLRIELNKGGVGISFHKLAQVSVETELFLRMLVEDIDRQIAGSWVAKDFENNSVDFTAEYVGQITPEQSQACSQALAYVTSEELDYSNLDDRIRRTTLLQYAKIARHIDADEAIYFRLYDINKKEPTEQRVLTREHSLDIEQRLKISDTISYQGSIQGVITALFKGDRPHCRVRELYSDYLIPCYFSYDLYDKVIAALHNKDTVVHIAGWVLASRNERKPVEIQVKRIEVAEPYLDDDLESFIGCAPNATGNLTTQQFLDLIRSEDNLTISNEEIA